MMYVGETDPRKTGRQDTIHNRRKRLGEKGLFVERLVGLVADYGAEKTRVIGATGLKAHCTASCSGARKI